MRCEPLKPPRRAACLFLSLLVCFLSYRPVTSVLAIAGLARNPTEGIPSTGSSQLVPRENMPRPAKSQQKVTHGRVIQKVQKSKSVTPEERTLLAIQMLSLRSGGSGLPFVVLIRAEGEAAKPQYLRMFQSGNPGAPNSPPA